MSTMAWGRRALLTTAMTALLWCGLSWSGAARAEGPSEIDKDAARLSLEQGDERMKRKDYAAALQAYRRADDIMGVPTTSIEVGRAAMALGKLVLALEAFERAAAYPKKKGEPEPFTAARADARKNVQALRPRIPRLKIEVQGAEPDVDIEVLIDEDPVDAWASTQRVDPGMHDVRAVAVGYKPVSREVVLQEGETRTLVLELIPLNVPPRDEESNPWWTVAAVSLPIGGASLIAGAVTGGLSLSDASAVKDQCDGERCPPEAREQLDRSQTLAHVSTATLVVGGVAAVLGITALALALSADDDDQDPAATLHLGPLGATLELRF